MPALENRLRIGKSVPSVLLENRGIDETTAATLAENSDTDEGRQAIAALPEVNLNPEDVI